MDQILKGIVNSNHPKAFKQHLIDRCFVALPVQGVSSADYLSILRISWDYAVNGETEFVQGVGTKVYNTWISCDKTLLTEFFNISSLNHFINDESVRNKDVLIKLVGCTLKHLQDSSSFSTLCQIIQCRCVSYLHNNRTLSVLKELITLLQSLPLCIPYGESAGSLAVVVIQSIADTEIPSNISLLTNYMTDINAICAFLPILRDANKGVIEKTFNAIFLRLSSEDSVCSPAISCIIDILPLQLIDNVHSNIGKTSPRRLAITVIRMLDCLSWPGSINLDKWIIAVFRGLAEAAMYTLLAKLFEATVEQVYKKLYIIVTRSSALAVLTYMLLSYQHSPALFHKIAGDVPKLLALVKKEESDRNLGGMAKLFYKAMYLHAGFPDLYDPILQELKAFSSPSVAKIQEELMKYRWGTRIPKLYITSVDNSKSRYPQISRSETGLTGLENIGNTCYMNCILQTLYMTVSVRNAVLEAVPNLHETMLSKLQEVFAYLTLTQRPAYSPQTFLESTRPPWFEPGEQQDCAEFLRFVLDVLTEERKTVKVKEISCSETDLALPENQSETKLSFVENIFGGVLEASHKCLNCNNVSSHKEKFTDLHVAFPDSHTVHSDEQGGYTAQSEDGKNCTTVLHLEDLVRKCFEPERLEGENKYLCEKCNLHCIAERSVEIKVLPSHLILTLLRFSYNSALGKRTKILTEVDYPMQLKVPFGGGDFADYFLYAVVVHSGTSTERGHYYTFSRHSQVPSSITSFDDNNSMNTNDVQAWYLFNDSKISFSSFDSFQTLTQRFPTDTAYLLFYQKLPFDKVPQQISHQNAICNELRGLIIEDNIKYLQEQENETQGREERINLFDFKGSFYKDFDDTFPPSGGCGSSSGGSDTSFPRFVC